MHRPVIVIIEDDVTTCRALAKLLGADGFDVRCAHSKVDALRLIADRWPDVVLLDLMVADGDASPLIDTIREERRPTKIAVMTGSADVSASAAQYLSRADRVFIKPVVAESLLAWFRGE